MTKLLVPLSAVVSVAVVELSAVVLELSAVVASPVSPSAESPEPAEAEPTLDELLSSLPAESPHAGSTRAPAINKLEMN